MVKVSPQSKDSKNSKHKPRLRSSNNKYLRPGALAQIRYSKAKAAPRADARKERLGGLDGVENVEGSGVQIDGAKGVVDEGPLFLSPVRYGSGPVVGPLDVGRCNSLQRTPKTPSAAEDCDSDSRLEALPVDLLVKIMCHLHHDQLKAVFHVSQRIRKAVVIARQFHFNYTTPDRSRQEMLRIMTPLPTEHWPFSKRDGKGVVLPSPKTPKAPKHGPRPPSRIKLSEGPQIAAVLFQEPTFSARCMGPALHETLFKSLASNRVLFYEDELCNAVAQNKLR
ncbi:hypothetical protein ACET3Z_015459 [Daucus carota]